jgi:Zn-dependent peptidase ImmA (M78 family)/DNA-binding XRE family transcriptional regulator
VAEVDPVALGQRIAEARQRAGLTQADLAAAVSVDRSAIAKIETAGRRVTALELARIADVVDERIEWFVTDPPPNVVSYRNLHELGAASSTIDRTIERVARNVEFVLAQDERWSLAAAETLRRPDASEEAESSAAHVRQTLGLPGQDPALEIARNAERLGLLVFSFDLGPDGADAASILLPQGGIAVTNGSLRVGRRRLACAHEVGHYVFADPYTVDWRVAEKEDNAAWETRLDRFARAFLLPGSGLRQYWTEAAQTGADLRTAAVVAASRFRVDMSTLARRLIELGLVSADDAARICAVRTMKADIVELGLVVQDELAAPELPRSYIQAVFRLYRNEIISAARATDLLFDTWAEEDLPPLPPLPDSAIWTFVS